jgi:hypothetical protein
LRSDRDEIFAAVESLAECKKEKKKSKIARKESNQRIDILLP